MGYLFPVLNRSQVAQFLLDTALIVISDIFLDQGRCLLKGQIPSSFPESRIEPFAFHRAVETLDDGIV